MNILLKLLLTGMVAIPGLLWSGTSLVFAVLVSLLFGLLSYAIGDLFILPKTNNTFASTADLLLSFSFLWAVSTVFRQPYQLVGLFLTSFVISVVEFFYHDYLQRRGAHHSKHPG
ncbi:YndM family protein [Brevibacillus humidisoli]|uniref:DUF2512 family protein n=1 Tax=Brevibacillus humidisoli TaxID=2895522 RepID=UPI001E3B2DEF|nr:DUF2512 family protein [Brevibacillus humidisoli]UFJ41979.1 YndM family protein [Brevibacillus humidisoli]